MSKPSTVEFYGPDGLVAKVTAEMVPPVGGLISIRGNEWQVTQVTYCVDHADSYVQTQMRANVDIDQPTPSDVQREPEEAEVERLRAALETARNRAIEEVRIEITNTVPYSLSGVFERVHDAIDRVAARTAPGGNDREGET